MTHDIAFTRVCTEWPLQAFVIPYLQTLGLQDIFNFMMPIETQTHFIDCTVLPKNIECIALYAH